jgi:hypothetical protein
VVIDDRRVDAFAFGERQGGFSPRDRGHDL